MTRDEAKKDARNISYRNDTKESLFFQQKYVDLINKIYDDFESRICENCKHYDGYCNHDENKYIFGGHEVPKDFGCRPHFERKEDV